MKNFFRQCTKCKQVKPLGLFYRNKTQPSGFTCWCKGCLIIGSRNWTKKNQKKMKRYKRMRQYGITWDEYVHMYEERRGRCDICRQAYLLEGGHKIAINIDHDHKTGRIRGLLCWNCNVVLGKMCDDPGLLRRAAEYLEDLK